MLHILGIYVYACIYVYVYICVQLLLSDNLFDGQSEVVESLYTVYFHLFRKAWSFLRIFHVFHFDSSLLLWTSGCLLHLKLIKQADFLSHA